METVMANIYGFLLLTYITIVIYITYILS